MAVLTQDDLLEAIDKMTVLELSEFIKRFEERYGVTAAAPAAAAVPVQPLHEPAGRRDENDPRLVDHRPRVEDDRGVRREYQEVSADSDGHTRSVSAAHGSAITELSQLTSETENYERGKSGRGKRRVEGCEERQCR